MAPPTTSPPRKPPRSSASVPSLDQIETTVTERSFLHFRDGERHTHHQAKRLIDYATMPSHLERAEKIAHCCELIWVGRDDDGPCLCVSRCRLRMCPECERINGKILAHTLTSRVERWKNAKFLTLTMRPRDCSLRESITYILRCFNRLRQSAVWKQLVQGGVYVIEITRAKQRTHWHVHLHVLMRSAYIPHSWLSSRWSEITGGSKVVYIEKADAKAGKYMAKYLTKGNSDTLRDFERWPFYAELHGKRLSAAFGDEPKLSDGDGEEHGTVQTVEPLRDVVARAFDGDQEAMQTIDALAVRYPFLFNLSEPDTG